ncbi:MAG: nuclear transport factor 2 family protein [Saprospiraceae bacterium]|nr:nuclear transport factor 2 family protein [Saprospiraceae bacterium]
MHKLFYFLLVGLCFPFSIISQNMSEDEMKMEIMSLDKKLFQAVFEDCDSLVIDQLLHPDCIFYHDQSGTIPDKATFLKGLKYGPCSLQYNATRAVDEASIELFPMYQNGRLYGILQNGVHQFYAQYPGDTEKKLTSVAKFSHLWLKTETGWQLVNILSYDHQSD